MNFEIEHLTCTSGDWEVLLLNQKVFHEGHSIPIHIWLDLIRKLSNDVIIQSTVISDEDMEEGNY